MISKNYKIAIRYMVLASRELYYARLINDGEGSIPFLHDCSMWLDKSNDIMLSTSPINPQLLALKNSITAKHNEMLEEGYFPTDNEYLITE